MTDPAKDSNFTAYIAVGVLHHALSTRDSSFLRELWPTVEKAIEFVLLLRSPEGAIQWRAAQPFPPPNHFPLPSPPPNRSSSTPLHPNHTPPTPLQEAPPPPLFLLTGCSSIHQSLLCAAAIAKRVNSPRPQWISAAADLATVIRTRPELFAAKPHSMDWYYPILCAAITGSEAAQRLSRDWDRFVVPGLGVRCVFDQPWVTGGETAELALTLALQGDARARQLLTDIEVLRHSDGSYWTGYQFANHVIWPEERTTWTAGAILLATAALSDDPAVNATFKPLSLLSQGKNSYPIE
ncbi:hypothetical protein LWC34_02645 [Kibdelosporangium philippinense]|uniref:Prenyltransferase n=1 Tax=Kibdelosporangium philippinense TaxID=211113 RepID=A0ABS8Z1D1_9PSEU|nr:hypothetical protein [Kibdelosporangium philippinense]MCE7001744.1 hypothetical protein [Kibdelosporangium philippinense]